MFVVSHSIVQCTCCFGILQQWSAKYCSRENLYHATDAVYSMIGDETWNVHEWWGTWRMEIVCVELSGSLYKSNCIVQYDWCPWNTDKCAITGFIQVCVQRVVKYSRYVSECRWRC